MRYTFCTASCMQVAVASFLPPFPLGCSLLFTLALVAKVSQEKPSGAI